MEERNDRLEAELVNMNAENFELKTRLEVGISNVNAENSELKTRLEQGKKQCLICSKIFFQVANLDDHTTMLQIIHFLGETMMSSFEMINKYAFH